jgi:hypothetical protein
MNTHTDQFRRTSHTPPDEAMFEPTGEFAADLRNLRSAVYSAAENETAKPLPANWLMPAKLRRRAGQRRLILAWSSAALLCLGALPLLHNAKQAAPVVVVQSDAEDTALLEQVDSAVSESVPSSLAPLATLDSWSSDATNEIQTKTTLNEPEKKNVAQ